MISFRGTSRRLTFRIRIEHPIRIKFSVSRRQSFIMHVCYAQEIFYYSRRALLLFPENLGETLVRFTSNKQYSIADGNWHCPDDASDNRTIIRLYCFFFKCATRYWLRKVLCDVQIDRYRCPCFIAHEATRIIAHPLFVFLHCVWNILSYL